MPRRLILLYGLSWKRVSCEPLVTQMLKIRVFCLLCFTASACSKSALRAPFNEEPAQQQLTSFLAGRGVAPQSIFFEHTQKPYYERHQLAISRVRDKILNRHVAKIRDWHSQTQRAQKRQSVVYLLSGADVPNLLTFFPDCTEFLMVALQPAGTVEHLSSLSEKEMARSLDRLRDTVEDIAARNYFRSIVLYNSKRNLGLPGIAPLILTFLGLLDKEVLAFEDVALNSDGRVLRPSPGDIAQGFRVYFRDAPDSEVRTIVYLNMLIDADFADTNKPPGKLLAKMGKFALFLKAAIYLFHEPKYASLARELVKQTDLVIQDDSGIPLSFFTPAEWRFSPFGTYQHSAHLNDSKIYPTQKDLRLLFQDHAGPIDFAFGYGSWSGRSNLLVAERIR